MNRRNHEEEWITTELDRQREIQRRLVDAMEEESKLKFGGTPLSDKPTSPPMEILSAEAVDKMRAEAEAAVIHPFEVGQPVRCVAPLFDKDVPILQLGHRYTVIARSINITFGVSQPLVYLDGIPNPFCATRFEAEDAASQA